MATLSEIAALLIENELGKIEKVPGDTRLYVVPHAGKTPEHMTREQLTFVLQGNMDIARTLYGDEELALLEERVESTYPKIAKNGMEVAAKTQPLELVKALKAIAEGEERA